MCVRLFLHFIINFFNKNFMKKLFRILMAAAVLLTASCAKEDISSTIGGGEVEVTFTANLADMGTRAYGDGTQANVVYLGVYEAGSTTPLSSLVKPEGYGVNADGTASITVVLLKDKVYDLVFWAQNKDVDCYTRNWEGRNIKVSYDGVESQAEARDAFFLIRENYKAGAATSETTFELRRPFAQLNVGLSAKDVEYIKQNGFAGYADNAIFKTSEVTINNVNTVLSLDLNEDGDPAAVSAPTTNVTFAAAAVPTTTLEVNGVEYTHLSMNYLLVNEELIEVDYKFVDAKNTTYERTYYQVPVKRNYRTNILGQLISSPMDFTVIIKPEFEGDKDNTVEYPEDGKLENLINPLLAEKEATIVLQSDVTWETGAAIGSTPLIPEGAALENLVIQGGEISRAGEKPRIIFTGAGVGAVRAANGGTITFRNVEIVDNSVSYAEDAWEYTYLELGGKLVFEDCTFVNAMMFEGENASFTNCRFNSNKDNEYALWVSDGDVTVSESTFEGPRGIKVHEAYGSEVASVAVDKCTFILTEKPALAIGDVNAETSISIKNSEISAEPGDQGLYIYETDTDVTTFDFVLENNKVAKVVTTDDELAAALKANVETMTIILKNDLNVKSGHNNLFGGEKTKTLTIMGLIGTETLNFDTNYMPTMNCAGKMIVKNLKISRVAPSANTWDVRDLMLRSDIEMNDVILEKGVAVCGDINCKFTEVTFAESGDYYALWIEAAGANVELNNCTVTSAGRGIKIDEQYVGAEEKALVNLSVAGTTFNTKNKAAILVKSAAGAKIAWGEGNNISKVAADKVNAVWVDEDADDYYDLVEVTGCTKMLEGALDNIMEDLESGKDVTLISNVTGSAAASSGYGATGIVIDGQTVDGGGHTLTVNGANSTWDCAVYHGGGTLKNITVAGAFRGVFTAGSSSDIILDNVIFKDVVYTFNSDDGNKEYGVYISNSTLNGWTSHSDVHKEVVYTNCSFGEGSGYAFCRPYGPTKFVGCEFAEGYTLDANQTDKISLENCTLNGVALTAENFAQLASGSATVDGVAVKVISDGVVLVDGAYCLSNKAGLNWFANEVNVKKNAFTGKTVKLTADIDLQNAAWTPIGQTGATTFNGVFDGQNYTIYNLNVNSESQTGANYSSGLFGWVESHTAGHGHIKNVKIAGATIVGHHNCGALVGYITQETALVENCHVTGATISCTYANGDADGDKAGALIGNATVATPVKDCTAANSTVSAGRDAGQVIGAGKEANVTGCSATNVTVSANGTGTGANIRNEVIGRLL